MHSTSEIYAALRNRLKAKLCANPLGQQFQVYSLITVVKIHMHSIKMSVWIFK